MLRKSLVTIKQLAALPRSTLATSVARNDQNKLSFTVNFFNNQKIPESFKTSMTDGYNNRHLGNDPAQVQSMLETLGCKSLDELMLQTVPSSIRLKKDEAFEHGRNKVVGIDSQHVVLEHMKKISENNKQSKSYIGQGYYSAILPTVILRNVLENPKWYTPYTPYQAEISQGRLEMLLNWQTMITELTGMDISNASLLDEATSAAEAMAMSFATHNQKRKMFYVSESIFPQIIDVIHTRASMSDINLVIGKIEDFPWSKADEFCGVICQTPDNLGNVHDHTDFFSRLKEH